MSEQQYPASYYAASANGAVARPVLEGAHQCDVCIIGAGYTGLSAALALAEAGLSVIVLESARVGFGASGRNGGQIVNSYSRDLDVIERRYGHDKATAMGALAFEGGRIIRERVAKYGIACDLKPGNIFAAMTSKQLDELAEKKALWERYGHTGLTLIDAGALPQYIGSERYVGALLDQWGGHIHPLNLALGEAAAFETLGGRLFEQSAVTRIEQGVPAVVHTAGGQVRAEFVVVAGNAYLGNLVPMLAERSLPCGTQILATEPLPEAVARQLLPGDHCVEDCNYMLDYYRLSADRRLLYGGGTVYGARDSAVIEAQIRANLKKTFPQLANVRVDYTWTGNFLLTLSRLPQAGRIGRNIYYSQGCSGHGVTYTHLAGVMLAEAIRGESRRLDVFAGLPHHNFPGGRVFRVPMLTMGAWYYGLRDRLGM
ncbi:MAG: FAD-binding oxidoreductase [Paludibacterium sp.]|uniref:NAD(P)/FAD-dependent oxidoreductase n=1 Tax=Paludibacterium sp. TaxID=1917523 RepID=UPI0025D06F03|nr:FAD-binding oxidoreductase [Paludibacterium sp.]MBV8046465.1 FAD-binding oxidoreductase [Paludibacterium sp.]MBV8646180.1 FAD-binding oxidoreductase [Paludibacterium sp.]